MKRIFLSLLLLIAGSGLIVNQAHAGLLGNLKNQALQIALNRTNQQIIGAACLIGGLGCLWLAYREIPIFHRVQQGHSLAKMIESNEENTASEKKFFSGITKFVGNKKNSEKACLYATLAVGVPLTTLGTYLLLKK
jgi:hypothetical protein